MIRKLRLLAVLLLVMGSLVAWTQPRSITGLVTDSDGVPMLGVNVVIVGTTTGTITDLSGAYTLAASPGDQIQFRFVGMAEQTITVGDQTTINIRMELEATAMDEVVVVGYGVQKKESVVAAISQATGEEISRTVGGTDLANGMTGLMPGVITIKTSGLPGGSGEDDAGTEIYIRGRTTWNGGQPLILVDGVERFTTDGGGIRPLDIDPSEVESVSVLKDAAATAVFGVKGANGVIMITTKRGKIGKPTLSFESIFSASTISKIPPVLGSYEGNYLKNLAIEHELPVDENSWGDFVPQEILGFYRDQTYPELYPDVDWTDEFTNDYAFSQKYNMNVSGGTEFVKYFVSLLRNGATQERDSSWCH
jgi:TonB-dependent SusC/RagA subfamily outer membrane receptor